MRILFICAILISVAGCSSSKKVPVEAAVSEPLVEEKAPEPVYEESPQEIAESELWQWYDEADLPDLERRISPSEFVLYHCEYASFLSSLGANTVEVELPTTNGMVLFILENSNTMNEELAAKFPDIKSFKGKSDDGKLSVRLDANQEGLFAEISGVETKQLISPFLKGNKTFYALYGEDALPKSPRDQSFD